MNSKIQRKHNHTDIYAQKQKTKKYDQQSPYVEDPTIYTTLI